MNLDFLSYAIMRHGSKSFLAIKVPLSYFSMPNEEIVEYVDRAKTYFSFEGDVVLVALDNLNRACTKGKEDLALYTKEQENRDLISWCKA